MSISVGKSLLSFNGYNTPRLTTVPVSIPDTDMEGTDMASESQLAGILRVQFIQFRREMNIYSGSVGRIRDFWYSHHTQDSRVFEVEVEILGVSDKIADAFQRYMTNRTSDDYTDSIQDTTEPVAQPESEMNMEPNMAMASARKGNAAAQYPDGTGGYTATVPGDYADTGTEGVSKMFMADVLSLVESVPKKLGIDMETYQSNWDAREKLEKAIISAIGEYAGTVKNKF